LELLKEITPKLSRVAVFGSSINPGNTQSLNETRLPAKALGILIEYIDIRDAKEIDIGFDQAMNRRVDALLVLASPIINSRRSHIVELTAKHQLPAIYDRHEFAEVGGLISYGVSVADLDRRAATYVDRILKGAKPSDLPVEQAQKFELVINLKAAKQIGITVPPHVLSRADRVIR
jgi:putative ABC transport system substrate-binding protein